MKLLTLVAVLALAASIEAASNCMWGPSYWCKSRETARECQQTRYCQDNVWKGSAVSMEKGNVGSEAECVICEMVVQTVDQELETGRPEAEVKAALGKICSDLGKEAAGVCNALVEQYFNDIWQYLVNKMSPKEICNIGLKVCPSARNKLHSYGDTKSKKVSSMEMTECDICKMVIGFAEDPFLNKTAEDEVKAALGKRCTDLGGEISYVCNAWVQEYFNETWQYLVNQMSPQKVCNIVLKACPSARNKLRSYGATKSKKVSSMDTIECEVCKLVVQFVEEQFLNNKTEQEVQQALEDFCGNLGVLKDECTSLVDQYFPDIWQALVNNVDPNTICADIGLCNSTKVSLKFKSYLERSPRLEGMECEVCKTVAKEIVGVINSSASEDVIKDALKLACNYMGGFAMICRGLVDKEWPEIYANLMNIIAQPEQLCIFMKMCTKEKLMAPQQTACDLCKLATTFLKQYVDSNTTEQEVKAAVEQVCGLLPGDLGTECKSLIDQYFDLIWDLVKQEIDTAEICQQLGLCNSTKTVQLMKKPKLRPQADLCDLCKLATHFLKPYVDNNATEAEAKAAVEQVCKLLPGEVGTECSSLIDQYFDMIWQLFVQEVDTGAICVQLGLCNSTKTTQLRMKKKLAPQDKSLCDLCNIATGFLKNYVDQNSTEEEVKDALKEICSLIQDELSTECSSFVSEYFDSIWMLLKAEVDSGAICGQLGFCNSTMARLKKNLKLAPQQFTCKICQLVSGELKTLMDKNNSQQEVQSTLKKMCSLVPGALGDNCTKMVNQYFLLGWVVMKQLVDAGTFCGYVKMCNSSSAVVYLKEFRETNVGDDCSACKMVVETVKNIFGDNKTMDEADKLMKEVCPYLVGFSSECKKIIDMYLPQIWKLLDEEMDPTTICQDIKMCQSFATIQLKAKPKQLTKVKGIVECEVCTLAMKELVSLVSANSTEQEILDALDKVCGLIPKFGNECQTIMNDYATKIINLILSGVAPREICQMIGLCTSTQRQKLESSSETECILCKEVLSLAKVAIGSKTSESEISKVLEKVCDIVSPGVKSECQNFISTFGPELIQLLAKAIEPDTICREIKLCTSSSVLEPWVKTRKY